MREKGQANETKRKGKQDAEGGKCEVRLLLEWRGSNKHTHRNTLSHTHRVDPRIPTHCAEESLCEFCCISVFGVVCNYYLRERVLRWASAWGSQSFLSDSSAPSQARR